MREPKMSETISSEEKWVSPPSPLNIACDSVHVWLIELAQPIPLINELEALLAVEERERAGRFHFLRDRHAFTVAKGATRQILAHYLNANPRALIFDRGSFGKPSLRSGELRFNLSHSGEFALLAVAKECEVGVDIEEVREIKEMAMLAERNFSPGESKKLRAVLDSAMRGAAFFNCWTRKEAFIKALGAGLSHPLDTFEVTFLPHEKVELRLDEADSHRWMLRALHVAHRYAAALVVELPNAESAVPDVTCWRWQHAAFK
jgi:4'-phosphopantetheinyl transferase